MSITPQTRIAGSTLGTPEVWIEYIRARGGQRMEEVARFVKEAYRLSLLSGISAHLIIAQAIHETDMFRSSWWVERLNPAGIGITGDPTQNNASRFFPNGTIAARAMLVHVALYVFGELAGELAVYRHEDPRADAIPPKALGQRRTLQEFGHADWRTYPTWAADDNYGRAWARRITDADAAGVLDGTTEPPKETAMAVRFEKRIAINRINEYGTLRDKAAHFTIHENGNTSSSPYDEAGFVRSGGGAQRVSYTFSVGVEDGQPIIVQILPVWARGRHAGNAEGNAISAAVETCMAPPGATSDKTQAALEELLYMLYTGDPRIEGMDRGYTFSPDRTRPHAGWPGANPGCPQTMIREWGGISRPVNNVRKRLAGGGGQPQHGEPAPIPELDAFEGKPMAEIPYRLLLTDNSTVAYFVGGRELKAIRETPRLRYSSGDETVGPVLKTGETFASARWLLTSPHWEDTYYTSYATRLRAKDIGFA